MKIGKVFEKLAANPRVHGIAFTDKSANVTLNPGWTVDGGNFRATRTAHECRLYIESAIFGATAEMPVPPPPPAKDKPKVLLAIPSPVIPRPTADVVVLPNNLINLPSRWAAECASDAGDHVSAAMALRNTSVRATPRTAALLVLARVLNR